MEIRPEHPDNEIVLSGDRSSLVGGSEIDNLAPDDGMLSQIASAISELGFADEEAKVSLFRMDSRNPSIESFLTDYSIPDFTLQKVRDDFGGGYFRARVYVPRLDPRTKQRQGNAMVIAKAPRFRIEGEPRMPGRNSPEPVTAVVQTPAGTDMVRMMMDGFKQITDNLAVALQKPEKTLMQQLEEIKLIKEVLTPANQPANNPLQNLREMLDMAKSVRELAGVESGPALPDNPSDNTMLLELGRMVFPAIAAAIQKGKDAAVMENNPAQLSAPEAVAENPAPVSSSSDKPAPEVDPVDLMQKGRELMLKGYVASIVAQARANNPVEPVAQEIYDQATDEFFEWIKADDWMEKLAAYDPGVKNFPVFFQNLRNKILEIESADTDKD